ncbi:uncharacterized protein LOC121417076 [Lytechinus variegatus]|uniref:uncharacterized protein LOC121417076 n=1 Tax=Lytechinus variegatus TaxID=7654 RepID=UPI001BB140B3|nr:uncharacterized protein LOC121417076 [Lytechinus variegatus]
MATHRNITDGLLCKLAENIEPDEQMETLARKLGFEQAAINRYTETNILEGQVTCKGTRDMLFDWRQRVEPSNQHPRLRQALIDANLIMLADTYLKKTLVTQVPDIYSKKISESLTVRKCRTILEDKYSNWLCKIQMKPYDKDDYAEFEDMHTVVTMVKKDSRGNDIKEKEILQGSVGKIFSAKVNGKFPSRILISAPAGRGKTTAVAKMAHDWVHREEGSGLEDLPLLFVVKFRNTSHSTSIGEAIISQLLGDVKDLTPEGLEEFIRQHQGICHIVFDGLDEYAGISSSSNIMSILRWIMFPQCRVLVTTRPHLENIFSQGGLPRVYMKMGIEGFSRESSCDYIDRFFTSVQKPMKADGLKVYLDEQPLIEELVKTPLFCLMVCDLWSEDLLNIETTNQTELLDKFNVFLMLHANARTPDLMITHEQLNKIILQLGKVALTGLLADSKKLVFTPRDFQKIPSVLDKACELGIVSKTTVSNEHLSQTNETSSTTIEFYHKLAQEHAAGKFLGDETNNFLLNLKISKLDQVLRKINENIVEYENLIRLAAATKSTACVRIMEMLLTNRYLSESERCRIILDCSSESGIEDVKVLPLVRKCIASHTMHLKSPTVYTCVGIRNLPVELKNEVQVVAIEESTTTTSVTNKLWHCLRSLPTFTTLDISDSYLSFPPSPPELPSVTKLSATRMMSQCCNHLISSLPCLRNIDVKDAYKEDFVDVLESSTCLTSLEHLHVGSRDGWYFKFDASSGVQVRITTSEESELTADVTRRMWSCLKSFPSLHTIGFTDSYLSIPSSLPELPSFGRLTAERMTLNCYKSVLSSLPNARELDVSLVIEDTSMNTFEITTDTKPMKEVTEYPHDIDMVNITLQHSTAPTSDVMNEVQYTSQGITLSFEDDTKEHWRLFVCGEMDKYEPIMVDLFDRTTQLPFLKSISYKSPNAVDRVEVESPPSEAKTESESQLSESGSQLPESESHLAESESRLSNFDSQSRTSQPTVQPEEIDILTAVQLGHTSAIERLMRHGADINAPSIDGQICLHNAIKFCYKIERNVEETDTLKKISDEVYNGSLTLERALVFYLLDNGARVDVKDGSGKLPIHYAKDDVIKQMIFSRYKSVEEMQSYREKPAQRPDLTVVADGCVPKEIELEDRGVSMLIPSDAIHRDETPQITLTLLRDPTSLDIKDDESLACYGIRCDPPNMGFLRPVKIKIPHATLVANPEQVKPEIILYEWDSVNDLPRTTRHSSSNSPNKPPYCRLYERYLELYIGHCAEWWVVIPLEQHVIQHRFMCVPYIPDRVDSGKAIDVHLIMHANLPDMDAEIQEEEKKQSYHKAHPSIPISLATKSGSVDVISYRNDQAKDNKPERRVLSLKDALSKIKHQIVLPVTSHDDDTDIPVNIKVTQKGKKYDVSMSLSFIIRCSGERDLEPTPFNRVVEEVSRCDFQDSDILNIAEKMTVDQFYDLGVALGFKIPQLHAIEYRRLADRQQATFDMLVTWRKTQTSPQGAKEKLISIMESLDSSTTEMDIRKITSLYIFVGAGVCFCGGGMAEEREKNICLL